MGAQAVQQLRDTAIEIQMAPIRSSVHIPAATFLGTFPGWGRRQGSGRTGQANQRYDRRPDLVDGGSWQGAKIRRK